MFETSFSQTCYMFLEPFTGLSLDGCKNVFSDFRALIGELDEDIDAGLDFNGIKAEPLNSVSH